MSAATRAVVIDARPRGPSGPLAVERVLGRPILAHLADLAGDLADAGRPVTVHARADEHDALRGLVAEDEAPSLLVFSTGPTPEGAVVLRSDRLYDPTRLRRVVRRGGDPESAVVWRLDRPAALAGAEDELLRRRTYQPLGRHWALSPARALARALRPTPVRPNAVTAASGVLMLAAAAVVAFGPSTWGMQLSCAGMLALALVLDTADGHLARIQGTASEFGRWLDALLDELGDVALHAAVAWSAFARTGAAGWLTVGMFYPASKYLFFVATTDPDAKPATTGVAGAVGASPIRELVRLLGHADVRWHLWIALAALGRLDWALVAYAAYFAARTIAVAARKAVAHA
jgi:phosphatidylglycerophosphate synthase